MLSAPERRRNIIRGGSLRNGARMVEPADEGVKKAVGELGILCYLLGPTNPPDRKDTFKINLFPESGRSDSPVALDAGAGAAGTISGSRPGSVSPRPVGGAVGPFSMAGAVSSVGVDVSRADDKVRKDPQTKKFNELRIDSPVSTGAHAEHLLEIMQGWSDSDDDADAPLPRFSPAQGSLTNIVRVTASDGSDGGVGGGGGSSVAVGAGAATGGAGRGGKKSAGSVPPSPRGDDLLDLMDLVA